MYEGTTTTKFGRYHVAEPFRAALQHLYKGAPLKTAEWEIPIPVLDQEDLLSQGIDTAQLIPGAQQADALGSCTANATAASAAERYGTAGKPLSRLKLPTQIRITAGQPPATIGLIPAQAAGTANAAAQDESFAIVFYDLCTHQTGDPSQEWPPADCGSTGLYCCQELMRQGLISSYQTGTGAYALASMLQSGSVIMGAPWFSSWMEPDASGFVDGDGSMAAYEAAVSSGIAGGHETCIYQLPELVLTATGQIDLQKSWVRVRNSWSPSWGLHGDYAIHLSTIDWLSQQSDLKQFVL